MISTPQSNPEQNFLKIWLLTCVVGFAIGFSVGVLAGISTVYYPGGNLEISRTTSKFLTNFVIGVVTGGIISLFQWIVLRDFLSNAKWWILAGILGSSISAFIYYYVIPSVDVLNSFLSLVIAVLLIGFFKGYIEWLVLRKDYPNSKRWMGVRVLTNVIGTTIGILSLDIRAKSGFTIWGNLFILILEGIFQGYIFGVISGRPLTDIFEIKNEMLETQVQ